MPAPKIRGNYQELQTIAQTFGQEAAQTNQTLRRLKQQLGVLRDGDWVGTGATAFYVEMDGSVLPALGRLENALQQANQVTSNVNRILQQAEMDAARVFQLQDAARSTPQSGGSSSSNQSPPTLPPPPPASSNPNTTSTTDGANSWSITIGTATLNNVVDGIFSWFGVTNGRETMATGLSMVATAFDLVSLGIDAGVVALDGVAAFIGFTGGAAISVPGGEAPVVVFGPLGASVGIATVELGAQPIMLVANALATASCALGVGADILAGRDVANVTFSGNATGISAGYDLQVASSTMYSVPLTVLGDLAPVAFLSLPLQFASVLNDFGVLPNLPPLESHGTVSFPYPTFVPNAQPALP